MAGLPALEEVVGGTSLKCEAESALRNLAQLKAQRKLLLCTFGRCHLTIGKRHIVCLPV